MTPSLDIKNIKLGPIGSPTSGFTTFTLNKREEPATFLMTLFHNVPVNKIITNSNISWSLLHSWEGKEHIAIFQIKTDKTIQTTIKAKAFSIIEIADTIPENINPTTKIGL